MIHMGMRNDERFRRFFKQRELRKGLAAFLLGVRATIEQNGDTA